MLHGELVARVFVHCLIPLRRCFQDVDMPRVRGNDATLLLRKEGHTLPVRFFFFGLLAIELIVEAVLRTDRGHHRSCYDGGARRLPRSWHEQVNDLVMSRCASFDHRVTLFADT